MIIISSDHGSVFQPDDFPEHLPYSQAASTLLIKPINQNSEFEVSDYPAQLSDIPITIANAINLEHNLEGQDLLNPEMSDVRTRTFNYYFWSHEYHDWSKTNVPPITRYKINGPLNRVSSWQKDQLNLGCDIDYEFIHGSEDIYSYDYGLSVQESWGRWTEGEKAKLIFFVNRNCKPRILKLKLNAFVSNGHTKQSGKVFINGALAGNIEIDIDEIRPKEFIFQIPEDIKDSLIIELENDNPVSPRALEFNDDERILGFGLIGIKLESQSLT